MNLEKKKDGKQAIFNILSQLVLNGTNFILIMIFTRFLTTDNYGLVSIYQAYVLFLAVVVGLHTQGSIGPAFVHIQEEEHNNYLASIMFLSFLSFIAMALISILCMPAITSFTELESALILLMLGHCFGSFAFNFLSIKYVYMRKAEYSFLLSLIMSLLMILCSYVGITQTQIDMPQYMGRILGLAIPYIACGVYALIVVFLKGNPFKDIKKYWKFCLPICLPLIVHALSQVILRQTDKIMLQKMLKETSTVGIYSFIVTFVHILNSIYTALNNTWVPIYYRYTKDERIAEIKQRALEYAHFFTMLIIGFLMVSPEFVKLFADPNYWEGMSLIPIVVLSTYMVFMYSFAVNYEIYNEQTKMVATGTSMAAICNIILNALLIPVLSALGAAVATFISYVALYLFHEYYARHMKNSNYPFSIKFFSMDILVVIVFSIITHFIQPYWFIRWTIAVLDGLIILRRVIKNKAIF